MSLAEVLRTALRGVGANRLRSALTILGILIGVASVIVLIAVGNGSTIAVQKQFQALGTNSITVQAGGFGRRGPAQAGGGVTLTMNDVAELQSKEYADVIKAVVPSVNATGTVAEFDGASTTPDRMIGTTGDMLESGSWTVRSGRFFNQDDVANRDRVVVLGGTVATALFGEGVDPVGAIVKLNHNDFSVIGILKSKGSNGTQDQDNVAFAPHTAVRDTIMGGTSLSSIVVQAVSAKATVEAQSVVTTVIADRNGKTIGTNQGFLVLNQATLLASRAETSKTLTVLLGAVAAISLLVGGIGIMNIMLVTVTERTREIGIRKAVGTPKGAILLQFLMEAVVLGGLGGLVGVAVGLIGGRFKIVGVQAVVRYDSVLLALFVAVAVSLFFGFSPAYRAASMRPIDALRHE
jgi:putative ABC transport system permease protein